VSHVVNSADDRNDPDVAETDRLRRRIAELEQVVRELRQKHPRANTSLLDGDADAKKRRVIVDRFARFKIDEAAMAAVAAAAGDTQPGTASPDMKDETKKPDYRAEPYSTHSLPGEEMVYDTTGRKTFLGAPAGKSLLRRVCYAIHLICPADRAQLRELTTDKNTPGTDSNLLVVPEDTAFTGWFPDMRKTFPFTTIWSHENFSGEIIGLLPNAEQSEL
jgi:hypothetical protein